MALGTSGKLPASRYAAAFCSTPSFQTNVNLYANYVKCLGLPTLVCETNKLYIA
jgi:hypothetical protein